MTDQRFEIGTKFQLRRSKKDVRDAEVVDVLKTYNSAGKLVKLRYVVAFDFCGQRLTDCDVCDVTIAKALHQVAAA